MNKDFIINSLTKAVGALEAIDCIKGSENATRLLGAVQLIAQAGQEVSAPDEPAKPPSKRARKKKVNEEKNEGSHGR